VIHEVPHDVMLLTLGYLISLRSSRRQY